MRKNNTHDYALSAFFMYAKENYPKSDELKALLKDAEKEYLSCVNSKNHSRLTEKRLREKAAEIRSIYLDVLAIEEALTSSADEKSLAILQCVKNVYFEAGKYGTRKGLIDSLVVRCSMDMHMSVSNVYVYLAEGLKRFCLCRGLRMEPGYGKSIKTLKNNL